MPLNPINVYIFLIENGASEAWINKGCHHCIGRDDTERYRTSVIAGYKTKHQFLHASCLIIPTSKGDLTNENLMEANSLLD